MLPLTSAPCRPSPANALRLLASLPLILSIGCESEAESQSDAGTDTIVSLDGGPPDGSFDGVQVSHEFTERPVTELFAETELQRFDLHVSPSDLQQMKEDAAKWYELDSAGENVPYVPADLVFRGQYIGRVGVRHKGTYGTLKLCFEGNTQICPKLSLKLRFDEYDSSTRFFGMKKLNLHSMVRDPSMMHERLAYDLFRRAGIHASHASHARVYINGTYQGVFAMIEVVDGHMMKEASSSDGNLYKEVWPVSGDESYYAAGLENNKTTADHSKFIEFYRAISGAAPEDRAAVVERWAGGDHMLRYMAVLEAIRYWDSIVGIYCSGSYCGNHNYYWYQDDRADGTRFQLVPWDLDTIFSLATLHDAVPPWYGDPIADCSQTIAYTGGVDTTLKPSRCDPFIDGVARLGHEAFAQRLTALVDGPFKSETMTAKIDTWASQIASAVAEDPNYPAGEAGWRTEIERLKRDIPLLRQRVVKLRDGTPLKEVGLSLTKTLDFEDVDLLDVAMALEFYANSGTDFTPGLSTTAPLAGTGSLRLAFEYRNTADLKPWAHYAQAYLPFENHAFVDLSQVKEIRIKARADSTRTVRFDINNPDYTRGGEGIRYGWDVQVGPTVVEIVLPMSTIAWPTWATGSLTDKLADILKKSSGMAFQALCNNRGATGLLPAGTSDPGFLDLDDITFVLN